jgi:hypothetical protein
MKYAVEIGSGCHDIPSLIKTGSGILKLIGVDSQTAWRSHNPLFIFVKIRKAGKKIYVNICRSM